MTHKITLSKDFIQTTDRVASITFYSPREMCEFHVCDTITYLCKSEPEGLSSLFPVEYGFEGLIVNHIPGDATITYNFSFSGDKLYHKNIETNDILVREGDRVTTVKLPEEIRKILDNSPPSRFHICDVYEDDSVTWFSVSEVLGFKVIIASDDGSMIILEKFRLSRNNKIVKIGEDLYFFCSVGSRGYLTNIRTMKKYHVPPKVIIRDREERICTGKLTEGIPLAIYGGDVSLCVPIEQLLFEETNTEIPVVEPSLVVRNESGIPLSINKVTKTTVFFTNLRKSQDGTHDIKTLYSHKYCWSGKSARK